MPKVSPETVIVDDVEQLGPSGSGKAREFLDSGDKLMGWVVWGLIAAAAVGAVLKEIFGANEVKLGR